MRRFGLGKKKYNFNNIIFGKNCFWLYYFGNFIFRGIFSKEFNKDWRCEKCDCCIVIFANHSFAVLA